MSFWQAKTKLRPADKEFSQYIRRRDGECVFKIKCNGGLRDEEYLKTLTCSHFKGRRKESTRFDPENCDTACRKCHLYLEEHKEEYEAWKLSQLGERFNLLILRSNQKGHKDDLITRLYIKELMKDLKR